MCLQGLDQSGQEQLVSRSRNFVGKSDSLDFVKACSISSGISPASSLAAKRASSESACASFFQSASDRTFILIVMLYGLEDEPWTFAEIAPLLMSTFKTWPLRAYERPRLRRAPMSKLS